MFKPIKALHVVSVDKENYYLNNLCDYTDREAAEFSFVTFAAEECGFVREIKRRGHRIYALDAMERNRYPQAVKKIREIIAKDKPDIVHTHLFDPSLIGLSIAKRQKRKTVLTRHHSDALYEIPSPAKRKFYLMLERYINRNADYIIAPSQMVRDILVGRENVAAEKVSVIPYGQRTERFDAVTGEKIEKVRADLEMKKNLSLVCTARLFDRKGHRYLFEAFSALTRDGLDATLYLVGTGDYKTVLERLARNLKIDNRVKFLGWRDDALAIIAAADIVVHPSLEDALSSAVIESLMLERPVVATDISGVRDSLASGKYGKIVPPADAESFRAALQETIKNIDEARKKAAAGRKYLLKYMDAKRVADAHLSIYRNLLA